MTDRPFDFLKIPDHLSSKKTDNNIIFGCHDGDRSMLVDGEYFSPILEGAKSLIEDKGYNIVNLSHPYSFIPHQLIKGDSLTINYRYFSLKLWMALTKFILPKNIRTNLRVKIEVTYFRYLIKKISPKVIFAIQPPENLCKAARSLGITVIELMHGTNISKKDKIFANHMSKPDEFLPNIILCFDDCTYSTVSEICIDRDITSSRTHDPWNHLLQYNKNYFPQYSSSVTRSEKFYKHVLITLQWGYDGERDCLSGIIPNGILHPELEKVIRENTNIFFSVRLHPIQRLRPSYKHHRTYIETLCSNLQNIEINYASIVPLPALLKEVDCHITMCSSSVGEAAVANVPSLLLCPSLQEGGGFFGFFRELEESGQVCFEDLDSYKINDWIETTTTRNSRDLEIYNAEKIQIELSNFYSNLIEKHS